jgi:hypothetical protein
MSVATAVGIAIPAALASSGLTVTTNLIKNGGAEIGLAAPDSATTVPAIALWTKTGGFTTVVYGAPGGFPDAAVSTAIKGGKNFFAGGPANPDSGASQVVSLASRARSIDKGKVTAILAGYLGGYSSQRDALTVSASFLDATGQKLGSVKIGPVTPTQRKNLTTLIPRSARKALPAGTRSLEIQIRATRTDGSYNDGYADRLSLTLATS